MNVIRYPTPDQYAAIAARPVMHLADAEKIVAPIMERVRTEGDAAIRQFTRQFDQVVLDDFRVTADEIAFAKTQVSPALQAAIQQAQTNIETFHRTQLQTPEKIATMPGVVCWRKSVPIQKVGLYIPGGTAPLFSTVLMLGVPAYLAGCPEVILCTPANRESKIHPAILFAADAVGIRNIYKMGGAQAIAAMAYGTESVPRVHKLFGPGNQYVTVAKQLASREGIAIDMPAGPSEVAVYADEGAHPAFVAADLLSQAEHGRDSQVILVSESESLVRAVLREIDQQTAQLPRQAMAESALANSRTIIVRNQAEAVALLNEYAAEHLILAVQNADEVAEKITNAGSVFLGYYTPESAGDYASGTNHTLPTNGFAKAYSGVSVDSFVKKITFQQISPAGLQAIGTTVEEMAAAEELLAHKNAVRVRLTQLNEQ